MKRYLLLLLCALAGLNGVAQEVIKDTLTVTSEVKTITKNNLTLHFIRNVPFDVVTEQRLIDAFFIVYPKEVDRFNKNAATEVTFMVDSGYKGVAATSGGLVRFNPNWFFKHPEDIDVVTHEVMHIVQDYGGKKVPGWLTEGIADYARYTFGINNTQSGWSLPPFKPGQNYKNPYRITARFLVWADKIKKTGIVDTLDSNMRAGTYSPDLWVQLTGKNIDDLWLEYAANPVI